MALRIPLRKVTIIAERVLRDDLITLIKERGASGWTLTMVEGEGSRGIRASEWELSLIHISEPTRPY